MILELPPETIVHHIDDVAAATLAIAERAPAGECYHLSTDRFVSIRELVEMVCREMGADFDTVVNVTDDRPGKDAAYLLDSTKARTTLGWEPRISLEDGVRQTIDWLNTQFAAIASQEFDYIHKP